VKRRQAAASAARPAWRGGWLQAAQRVDSPNFGSRPQGTAIELVVIHSISLPPGEYGGDAIERLFTNRLEPAAHPYFESLRDLRVSAHFLVRRDGELLQFVSCGKRAWHAGESTWNGRPGCNDFSIGVELEGLEGDAFEEAQYERLGTTLEALSGRYPIRAVTSHAHIAPGRKQDPGAGFHWDALLRRSAHLGLDFVP
jgi:AmpD protein